MLALLPAVRLPAHLPAHLPVRLPTCPLSVCLTVPTPCLLLCLCWPLPAGPDKAKHLRTHLGLYFAEEVQRLAEGQKVTLMDPDNGLLHDFTVEVVIGGDRAFLGSLFGCNHMTDFCIQCNQSASDKGHEKGFFQLWEADGWTSLRCARGSFAYQCILA
jgi:hypothetical protein